MDKKKQDQWIFRWNAWVARTKHSGIWKRKEGGHVVRVRAVDPTTGRDKEIRKVLRHADEFQALRWQRSEFERINAGVAPEERPRTRFREFARWLLEKKVNERQIRSAKGRLTWECKLVHLINGTTGRKSGKTVTSFGDMFIDKINISHVDEWKGEIANLINAGDYSPVTVNGWISILRVIDKAAKRKFSLPGLFTDGLENFDESDCETYTEEEPNALLPEEVGPFMNRLREIFPAHYAMAYLSLITGLRPSSLRPLRRRGEHADVLWDKNRILVRRSHTLGEEVMNTTKQRTRYSIDLPAEAMNVLRWHVETQLTTDAQQDSELLFPAVNGRFRTPCVLNKPLEEVARDIELGKKFTQRGFRRTFNDLARAAQVNDLVTRSISGHLTASMQQHYSTVNNDEQRGAIAKVIQLFAQNEKNGPGELPNEIESRSGTPSGTPSPLAVLHLKKPAPKSR